jgi:hypothetical protein
LFGCQGLSRAKAELKKVRLLTIFVNSAYFLADFRILARLVGGHHENLDSAWVVVNRVETPA